LLLIGALALSLSNVASGQDRAMRFRDWDVVLTVNTDGSLDVTERLNIKFTGRWSRIQRDISLRPTTAGGRPPLDIRRISATDADGQPLRVEVYSGARYKGGGSGGLHVGIWITPYPINEDRTVIIRYHVTNAIRFDELLWSVNDAGSPIDKAHVVVVLPTGVEPTRTVVYTRNSDTKYPIPGINPAAKVAADAKIETDGNTVGISLPRALSAFEVMTVVVGWPSGLITEPIKAPERPGISITQWWPLSIPLIIFVVAFTTWQRRGGLGEGSYVVRYEPTDEMSPAELGTLVDDSMDGADLTATMVDLAARGFLRIEEVVESHPGGLAKHTDHIIHIIRFPREWARLKLHESLFLTALNNAAGRSKTVRNSALKRRFVWPAGIRDAIYDSLVSSGYYFARPDKRRKLWKAAAVLTAVLGIGLTVLAIRRPSAMISPVPVTTAAVLSALILFVFAPIMPARTPAGTRTREAALGLKDFLSRVKDPHNTSVMTSPELFQRYLPYAIALGVADNWAKAFDDLYGGAPQWFVNGTGPFSASSFSRSIGTMSSAVASRESPKSPAAA
jgi:hypothetical protein